MFSCNATAFQVPHSKRLFAELQNVELETKLENLLVQLIYFRDMETKVQIGGVSYSRS